MSEKSCPVSGSGGGRCPVDARGGRMGSRGCSFMSGAQSGDLRTAFNIPPDVDPGQFLRQRERKAINEVLYSNIPTMDVIKEKQNTHGQKSLDMSLNVSEQDLLAIALGAPARQVILRAEEVGPQTGWRDGYLSAEHGFTPPDVDAPAGALAKSPGRVWSDLCERMPGCVARGRVRESVAALPVVPGTPDVIPDKALWAALVSLAKHNGSEGVSVSSRAPATIVEMSDDLGDELKGIPKSIGLPYYQISKRMGRSLPHMTFYDQADYNIKHRDPTSTYPYIGRFDNTEVRWPMFGDSSEKAFMKGCADTSASFQHGPDAIASCQEHVMSKDNDALLRDLINLKEILERMPNAFHTISLNPSSGENYVSPTEWVRWAKWSTPLSKRTPAMSGLQFPAFLVVDAFLGRKKYESFLGVEGVHLRAWAPSNWRAFMSSIENYYRVPEYVAQSGDPRLMGALDGIVEAYTGERGFMGTHRYKVFGMLEVAGKTGRTETNGASGATDAARPWEATHQEFSQAMQERLEPFRGSLGIEPHEMRGSFWECRYKSRVLSRAFVDSDPNRSIASVILDIQDTGITFQPGDRLAIMPLNSWMECAKVAAALGLDTMLDHPVDLDKQWTRFAAHLGSVSRTPTPHLTVKDILRRGHLSPLTEDLVMKLHNMLRASSNTVLQVLATEEWPVRASLGDVLQASVAEVSSHIWDQAFDLTGNFSWLAELIPIEVPRTYSISNYPEELLPSTVDLTISRSDYKLCSTFSGSSTIIRHGVSSNFLNPVVDSEDEFIADDDELLIGVSRPLSFQLPIDDAAPCMMFAGGSGVAPFRSFWQARAGSVGRNMLFLGVQSREKFCYEHELRQYVNSGYMEVYTAFSRDSRGLAYDRRLNDLVEKETSPRYIDALILEQGGQVCDMVMSKKQGGFGGYLYVCGSLSVFDSVMSGIRKAIYNHRTTSMESSDEILNVAFAERRFMLDVFMTPRPLPCNDPTIPLSQLAMHTGHEGSKLWIGVHGSVYDVTDFCPMHPGGTNIIKSNAGVDCSKTFDLLGHTNNPEVSSLLNKYFIGKLSPKPNFHHSEEISMLYDLWSDYLRTSVETLVAHQFEVQEFMGSSNLWFQGSMLNMGGVRRFYHHQSRLLQSGFSFLYGPKLQELYLKLSFTLANSATNSNPSHLPDVLGIISRAKCSPDAMATSNEVSQIGQFTADSEAARFHERGIINYAKTSVKLNMELLQGIREEACRGMDVFDTVMDLDAPSETQRCYYLSAFLINVIERIAIRLEGFYAKLAEHSIYTPEIEQNPARSRWNLVRRKIRDGSFFVLTQDVALSTSGPKSPRRGQTSVEFDQVISQIQQNINNAPRPAPAALDLTEIHVARGRAPQKGGMSAYETSQSGAAVKNMSAFLNSNLRSIRRLSKMPTSSVSIEQLMNTYGQPNKHHQFQVTLPTPPLSRSPSRSPSLNGDAGSRMNIRGRGRSSSSSSLTQQPPLRQRSNSNLPSPPMSASAALPNMLSKMNRRQKPGSVPPSPARIPEDTMMPLLSRRATHSSMVSAAGAGNLHKRGPSMTGSLRGFLLQENRVSPTF
ncbi:sulfite reductase flavoprotein alpha-component [Amylocarpus encephaloides]|uniref:NADPH--hemoprotein reductase n=1 Tax=Amylocarpus encephaloides TaxID=45428 RepID=A0A9P7YQZ9_9HELO|nr:sulfite reductase flavoprotein alpha-component [Amylocarpus encephaloides]